MDKFIDESIEKDVYSIKDKELSNELVELENQINQLNDYESETMSFVEYGLHLLKNLGSFFNKASVSTKQKMLSSIFKQKLVFEDKKYRTPKFKEGFEFIYMNISKLEGVKTKREDNLSKISPLVLEMGLEPIRTLQSTGF